MGIFDDFSVHFRLIIPSIFPISQRQTPGFRPVDILPADPSREVPIVEAYYYDQPDTYHLKESPNNTGKSIMEVLGPENIARIVAFMDYGSPKRSEITLEYCKRAFYQFKVTSPISYAMPDMVRGFIELKDGGTLNWTLSNHDGMLHVGEIRFFRK